MMTPDCAPETPEPVLGKLDELCAENLHHENEHGINLISLNEKFRERWEPGTIPYAARIASLKALHDAGCRTWVSMAPFPALTQWGMASLYGYRRDVPGWNGNESNSDEHVYKQYLIPVDAPKWVDEAIAAGYGELISCLYAIRFVDKIIFGFGSRDSDTPSDVLDMNRWYAQAVEIVRDFCNHHDIECSTASGTTLEE